MKEFQPILYSILFCFLFLNSCSKSNNQSAPISKEFENLYSQLYKNNQFNGTVLVLKDGETIFKAAYGKSHIETNDTLKVNSSFRLASVSKQFTAMGIMILKEQKKLSFDQDINEFIPELPYKNITIRNLLNHSSGLPDYEALLDKNWKPDLKKDDPKRFIGGNEDIVQMLVEKAPPIRFNPLDRYEYSNTGYVLLATIIERITNQSFGDFLNDEIFKPVQMTNTRVYHFQPDYDPDFSLRVFGFRRSLTEDHLIQNDVNYLNFAKGDGGVFSSVEDLLKWDRYLYQNKIVSSETLKEAFSPVTLNNGKISNYGFGWGLGNSPTDKKVVSHGGGWVGFRTYFYRGIEDNNCYIILTNDSNGYLREIRKQTENILYELPYEIPKKNIDEVLNKLIIDQGIDSTLLQYKELRDSKKYAISEYRLNNTAYSFLKINRYQEAIKIYRLSLDEYPNSAYTNKYIGEAFLKIKDTSNALIHYKKSYEIDTSITDSYKWIQKLSK